MDAKNIELEIIDCGFDINIHRFPYTYHHDYVRCGTHSRADISRCLDIICKNDDEYYYSACYGAILYLFSKQPEKINHNVINLIQYCKDKSIYNVTECDLYIMRDIINLR